MFLGKDETKRIRIPSKNQIITGSDKLKIGFIYNKICSCFYLKMPRMGFEPMTSTSRGQPFSCFFLSFSLLEFQLIAHICFLFFGIATDLSFKKGM